MAIETVNPATGELVRRYEEYSTDRVEQLLDKSLTAFKDWRETTFTTRAELLLRAAAYLRDNSRRLAETITQEMGKPITQALAEIEKCASVCEFYAERGERYLSRRNVETEAKRSYVRYDPLGPILAVMPWNFPFWQVLRFAAPALMAGNVAVLKHASNVPGTALQIQEVFDEAGFPPGSFTTLLIGASATEAVIRNKNIVGVTLTGSEAAGKQVAATAGSVLKKTVMELGGSDPFIVLADADLQKAAEVGAQARMSNCGQTCISSKRFIVIKEVAEEFAQKFMQALSEMKTGDPLDEQTEVGPMARDDLRQDLHKQVIGSLKQGARKSLGGEMPEGPGFYYPVTLLENVGETMPAGAEETFGPLAALIEVEDEKQAIEVANRTDYGLGACIWTKDLDRARYLVRKIEAGSVFVNGLVKSDPRLPFGGVKMSGYGRELAEEGIKEFVNIKAVWMAE
jgi:succinate-semialdehyde dehydrogenase / glutarate-semialdehyde dehydrogenase